MESSCLHSSFIVDLHTVRRLRRWKGWARIESKGCTESGVDCPLSFGEVTLRWWRKEGPESIGRCTGFHLTKFRRDLLVRRAIAGTKKSILHTGCSSFAVSPKVCDKTSQLLSSSSHGSSMLFIISRLDRTESFAGSVKLSYAKA